jgi:hypothetical protein
MSPLRDWIGKKGPFEPRLSRLSAARKRQALPQAATSISRKPSTHKALRTGKAVFRQRCRFNAKEGCASHPICGIADHRRVMQ